MWKGRHLCFHVSEILLCELAGLVIVVGKGDEGGASSSRPKLSGQRKPFQIIFPSWRSYCHLKQICQVAERNIAVMVSCWPEANNLRVSLTRREQRAGTKVLNNKNSISDFNFVSLSTPLVFRRIRPALANIGRSTQASRASPVSGTPVRFSTELQHHIEDLAVEHSIG